LSRASQNFRSDLLGVVVVDAVVELVGELAVEVWDDDAGDVAILFQNSLERFILKDILVKTQHPRETRGSILWNVFGVDLCFVR